MCGKGGKEIGGCKARRKSMVFSQVVNSLLKKTDENPMGGEGRKAGSPIERG